MMDNYMNEPKDTTKLLDPTMPVQFIKGVGPARAKAFEQLGIKTVIDLLEYFPRDWVFAPELTKIKQIQPGQTVTISGIVESLDYQPYRRTPIFEVYIADDSAQCRLIWFHGSYLRDKFEPGMKIMISGKVALYKHQLQITNPKLIILEDNERQSEEKFSGPVYPACANLSSRRIKTIIQTVLGGLVEQLGEFFDTVFLEKNDLITRKHAFEWIHSPANENQLTQAKRRLKYDELFLMQLAMALRRYKLQHFSTAPSLNHNDRIDSRIRRRFPFLLTGDQNDVIEEIVADMSRTVPMNRLLQGDVGSGKTVVALYAALLAIANKGQAAIMAPTEILAGQHFLSIERFLKGSDVKRLLITGGISGKEREKMSAEIEAGRIDIVVGTVALLEKDIQFKNLALVVIDEQHKFGVHQRAKLRKETTPHCLVMTATPIPRTLAMTAFGDLDVSTIKHSPPGRGKVITRYLQPHDRAKAYEFIRARLKAKKQAYFVYPRIVDSQGDNVKAATAEYKMLNEEVFPEFRVELLHGQMKSDEKQRIMAEFRKGKIDCLVATVIIEVGLDVPNATIMVIEGADRFGLAQLHQLRGRIGRGQNDSYCLLFAETESEVAKNRFDIMVRSNDGFEIAERDLAIRGPGEFFSARQHGLPDFKIANIIEDFDLLNLARKDALKLVKQDAMLTKAEHKNIRTALIERFGETAGLVDIA